MDSVADQTEQKRRLEDQCTERQANISRRKGTKGKKKGGKHTNKLNSITRQGLSSFFFLGFVGHMTSVTTTQLFSCNTKAAQIRHKQMGVAVFQQPSFTNRGGEQNCALELYFPDPDRGQSEKFNIHVIGVPEVEDRDDGEEAILGEILTKNFPKKTCHRFRNLYCWLIT